MSFYVLIAVLLPIEHIAQNVEKNSTLPKIEGSSDLANDYLK